MKAEDVPTDVKVCVEIEPTDVYDKGCRRFLVRTKIYDEIVYLPLDHPVYPDLLGLCRRLRDGFRDFVSVMPLPPPDIDNCKEIVMALKEADALLGPVDKEQ